MVAARRACRGNADESFVPLPGAELQPPPRPPLGFLQALPGCSQIETQTRPPPAGPGWRSRAAGFRLGVPSASSLLHFQLLLITGWRFPFLGSLTHNFLHLSGACSRTLGAVWGRGSSGTLAHARTECGSPDCVTGVNPAANGICNQLLLELVPM